MSQSVNLNDGYVIPERSSDPPEHTRIDPESKHSFGAKQKLKEPHIYRVPWEIYDDSQLCFLALWSAAGTVSDHLPVTIVWHWSTTGITSAPAAQCFLSAQSFCDLDWTIECSSSSSAKSYLQLQYIVLYQPPFKSRHRDVQEHWVTNTIAFEADQRKGLADGSGALAPCWSKLKKNICMTKNLPWQLQL